MRKIFVLFLLSFLLITCSEDKDIASERVSITLNFSHGWNGTEITNADFNEIKFTNANGQQLSIERLRYLISEVTLTHESGVVTILEDYNLVDLTNNENLSFTTSAAILPGNYSNISFRFGFNDDDNMRDYADLNTANFFVPDMLGGGYHYMQFDGKYLNENDVEAPFNYHMIRAIDISNPNNPSYQNTSFQLNIGAATVSSATNINVVMDLYEWFSNPNLWNLNEYDVDLMGNFNAQLLMSQNGGSVFSLVSITP